CHFLKQNSSRWSFCNESERTVLKYGNFNRNDETSLFLCTRIEFFTESHDVYTSLTQRRTYRWCRIRLTCRNLQFHNVDRSEEHTSELQSRFDLVCRLLL